ncbi:hypothetical protein GEMRC1_008862 [Eukaryota sp. GEM-RC1]
MAYPNTFPYKRTWIGLLLVGMMTNLPSCVLVSAAKSLAESFDKDNLLGAILMCNVAVGIFVRTINTWCLDSLSYTSRTIVNAISMVLGSFGMFYVEHFNFMFMLGCVVLLGVSSALGEPIVLCFLKQFPPEYKLVSAWGTGTGLSGIFAASFYLVCRFYKISDPVVFVLLLPFVLVYLFSFFVLISPPLPYIKEGFLYCKQTFLLGDSNPKRKVINQTKLLDNLKDNLPLNVSVDDTTALLDKVEADKAEVLDGGFARLWRVLKLIKYEVFNLGMVYCLEYTIITTLAKNAVTSKDAPEYLVANFYEAVQWCYQITVLISRSSLSVVQIPYIGTVTLFQFINFACIWLKIIFDSSMFMDCLDWLFGQVS